MKKIIFLLFASCLLANVTYAQIINPKETAKRKANDRVNNSIDRNIDKGLDKIEEGIGGIFKKKDKKAKKTEEEEVEETKATKTKKQKKTTPEAEETEEEEVLTAETEKTDGKASKKTADTTAPAKVSLKSYSKFDFVPGEKVLYYDDFERVAVGDFPADFNTNSSGEVMTIENKAGKWFAMTKNGVFIPEGIKVIPENSTIEFEIGFAGENGCANDGFGLKFYTNKEDEMDYHFASGSYMQLHPGGCPTTNFKVRKDGTDVLANQNELKAWKGEEVPFAKVSIWRQGSRIRVYVNQEKVWDIPRFFTEKTPYQLAFYHNFYGEITLFMTNLRLASAPADTRNKLLTEGKLVTRGILFDVNSDKLKPESYGVLKEIGTVLKENPAVRVKIIGHTDSDGDDAKNLDLSKRRAAAVKEALRAEFGIQATQMETDGKGESEPSEPNTTPQGKANNRRVEFIKL